MSNVAKELDDNLPAAPMNDEDDDGLQNVPHGDLCSMHTRHDSPDCGSRGAEYPNLGNMRGMYEGLDGACRTPHDVSSISTAVGEVHGDGLDLPSSVSSPETLAQPSAESMPFHVASHKHTPSPALRIVGEQHSEGLSSHVPSGMGMNLVANREFSKHLSENTVAFGASQGHADGAAPQDSPIDLSPAPDCNTREKLFKGSMYATSKDDLLHGGVADGDMPESPTAYSFPGWHARQNCVTGPNSHMTGMHVGKFPHEALTANGSVESYEGEKPSDHSPFSGSSPTRHTVVGEKQGLAEFACTDTSANGDFKGNVFNYRTSNNEPGTFVHEKSFVYNQPIVEDLQVNIEQPTFRNQEPSYYAKNGSVFSWSSSYYSLQSSYVKNVAHILRFGGAVFSLIAFSVMISNSEKRVAAGSTFYVRFSDFQAYNYLAALNLLTFLYSSGQLVLHAQGRTGRILSSPVKWGASVYLCDQMLAFLMISSSSSAATASELSRHGLHSIWPPACSTWKLSLFCSRADVAVAMSFVSCLFMFLSTFFSGYHLSNLLAE